MDDLIKGKELNEELNVVYRYLCKVGVPKEDAKDAVQEAAIKYLIHFDSIPLKKIRSWLIRVALNFYYDQYRKQKRIDLDVNLKKVAADFKENPESIYLELEKNNDLKQAIAKLKPDYQEMLFLKYQLALSYEEIGQIVNKSLASVKTNLFRAKKQLAKVYKEATENE
ncbi:RNA polymerase sigma factor [Niallia nealsonii]|uniref:RNA polymerase subunit sigma-70 n=1 Tax=Niallia nealsonii TaxID=115979 RepID=A0A2N0Z1B9_9BACI|nr:sigma-70 family RNA polymerase sigma factor [Niallia nealsonii]PKG23293.1 RNA polymerase subunit sigma-70 [Niallia nealsonii]